MQAARGRRSSSSKQHSRCVATSCSRLSGKHSHALQHAELAERCQVVLSSMVNDAALEDVFNQWLAAPKHPQGAVWVDQSTVAPAVATRLAEQAAAEGFGERSLITLHLSWQRSAQPCCAGYVSSPVFGRPDAAAARNLIVLAGGKKAHKEQVCGVCYLAFAQLLPAWAGVKLACAMLQLSQLILVCTCPGVELAGGNRHARARCGRAATARKRDQAHGCALRLQH